FAWLSKSKKQLLFVGKVKNDPAPVAMQLVRLSSQCFPRAAPVVWTWDVKHTSLQFASLPQNMSLRKEAHYFFDFKQARVAEEKDALAVLIPSYQGFWKVRLDSPNKPSLAGLTIPFKAALYWSSYAFEHFFLLHLLWIFFALWGCAQLLTGFGKEDEQNRRQRSTIAQTAAPYEQHSASMQVPETLKPPELPPIPTSTVLVKKVEHTPVQEQTLPKTTVEVDQKSEEEETAEVLVEDSERVDFQQESPSKDIEAIEMKEESPSKDVEAIEMKEESPSKDVEAIEVKEKSPSEDVEAIEMKEKSPSKDVEAIEVKEKSPSEDVEAIEPRDDASLEDQGHQGASKKISSLESEDAKAQSKKKKKRKRRKKKK
ncbi:MAG: hypothetical protein AAGJ35_00870, partial [Myxococcota bacterium]